MASASVAVLTLALASVSPQYSSLNERLRAALQERFPAVLRWEIKPIAAAAEHAVDQSEAVSVLKLGPRSALRVGKRVQWYAVAGFQPVLTATRRVSGGESLSADDGTVVDKNVLGAGCEPLSHAQQLNGMRVRKALHAGDMICGNAIEPQPRVARGDRVTVKYESERVTLVAKGVAQADAELGQPLLVINPESRQSFRAIVSGDKEVTIHE
jgi:flagella basal body P-ring formation protein FlgA